MHKDAQSVAGHCTCRSDRDERAERIIQYSNAYDDAYHRPVAYFVVVGLGGQKSYIY